MSRFSPHNIFYPFSRGPTAPPVRIRAAVVAAMKADAAVALAVGGRVYPLAVAAGKTKPSVAYQLVSDRTNHDLDGADGTRLARIRFSFAGGPEDLAAQIDAAEAVRDLFDGYSGEMQGLHVDEAALVDGNDEGAIDPAAGDRLATQAVLEFLFMYRSG